MCSPCAPLNVTPEHRARIRPENLYVCPPKPTKPKPLSQLQYGRNENRTPIFWLPNITFQHFLAASGREVTSLTSLFPDGDPISLVPPESCKVSHWTGNTLPTLPQRSSEVKCSLFPQSQGISVSSLRWWALCRHMDSRDMPNCSHVDIPPFLDRAEKTGHKPSTSGLKEKYFASSSTRFPPTKRLDSKFHSITHIHLWCSYCAKIPVLDTLE